MDCSCSQFRLQWYKYEQAGFAGYIQSIADSVLTYVLSTSTVFATRDRISPTTLYLGVLVLLLKQEGKRIVLVE